MTDHNDDLLLDETLDDLADLPQTKPFPAGAYLVDLTVKANPNKKGNYIVELTHKETLELNKPDETEPTPGDKSAVFITTIKRDGSKNELGQGQLKMILQPLAELFNTRSVGEILEQAKSPVECTVAVAVKVDKNGQYDDSQLIKAIRVA